MAEEPEKDLGGRPEIEIDDDICDKAESLAAKGLNMKQIANVLGMGRSTLFDKKARFQEFSDAIKRGQDKGVAVVVNALFEKAKGETLFEDKVVKDKDGGEKVIQISRKLSADTTACIFFLKNRGDWKDSRDVKHSGNVTHKHEGISRTLEILREFRGVRPKEPVEGALQN